VGIREIFVTRRVTINDVAQHLGVAKGTVSRALNGYGDVSDSLRQRVAAAAHELGYKPSSLARRLTRGRADTVGMVLIVGGPLLSDPFLSEFLDGVSRSLRRRSRDLLVSTAPSAEAAVGEYEAMAQLRKVDGFLLTRTESRDPRVRFLQEKGLPFVTHGRVQGRNDHPWFDIDNEATMVEAVGHLAQLGHQRIGLIAAPSKLNFARLRLRGFRRGIAAAGFDRQDAPVETTVAIDIEAGRTAAVRLLRAPTPPTALVCMTDMLAIGAYAAVRDLRLRVGRDISVIGYDGLPTGASLDPPLTTFDQASGDYGAVVADLLLDLIDGVASDRPGRLERARFVARGSHGPPRLRPHELAALVRTCEVTV
jgi:LacI family transcriptional regulator